MGDISKETLYKLYDNLRVHFEQVVDDVLGKNYYNMGLDVYTTDANTCSDIRKKFLNLERENKSLKKWNKIYGYVIWVLTFICGLLIFLK